MAKYRKKPVVIEAVQYDGNNMDEIARLSERGNRVIFESPNGFLLIETLEGTMRADKGDFIIRGVSGEIYPCKPDIFEQTYEKVEE